MQQGNTYVEAGGGTKNSTILSLGVFLCNLKKHLTEDPWFYAKNNHLSQHATGHF